MSGRRKRTPPGGSGVPRSGVPGSGFRGSKGSAALTAIALAILTIAVYAQVGSHTFISVDDGDYVNKNEHVTGGLTAENVKWALTTGHASNWHPLTWISLQADVSAFGTEPGPLHLANLAWHVLDTLLLFGLLRAMTGSLWRSAFVAALFGVHPAHVESVAWVAERKDVLSAAFWFGTTWAYVAWTRKPSIGRYAIMIVLFALGLMSKPMLVTLPATLLLLDLWPLSRTSIPWSRRLLEKAPLFAMTIASSAITVVVQQRAMASLELVTWPIRISNAVWSYGRYLVSLFWPSNLAFLYPLSADIPTTSVALSAIVLVAVTAAAWRFRSRLPFLLTGWLWYLGTLVPVIGLLQVGMQAMADRYTYIPSIGIFVIVIWGGWELAKRMGLSATVAGTTAAVVVVGLAVATHAQAATWATNEALWRQVVAATTNNPRAHIELGVTLGKQSRHAEAEAEFRQALTMRLSPIDSHDLFPSFAGSLLAQNKTVEAIPQLEQAIALDATRNDLRHYLALSYVQVGRPDDAIASWGDVLKRDPKFEDAYLPLGVSLARRGQFEEARRVLTELLRLNPNRKDAQQALAGIPGK